MKNMAKLTLILMIVSIVSKFLGFTREIVLGGIYGASSYSDIYLTASSIPTVLFSLIGTAIGTTFIPLYYENLRENGNEGSERFVNNVLNILLVIGICICIFAFIFAEPLVKLFAVGFEDEKLLITIKFTRIIVFSGLIIIITNIITTFLQIKENFIIPAIIGIPSNIIIIISIIISSKTNIYILAIGTMIATISQIIFEYPFAYKKGYRYKWVFNIKDKYIKKMVWLVAPVIIGVGVNQINTMVDKTLASTLVEGSISALNYANKLNGFVMGVFIATLGAVVYPTLSKLSSEKDDEKFIGTVVSSVNSVVLLVVPISMGAIVLANPIVKLLFQRGAFDGRATSMTAIALVFYSIGMIGFGLRDILGKVFYSLQDTKTPMINGAIAMGLNIILNLILVKFMGHSGLAFATSISAIISIFLLFGSLKKKINYFGQDKIFITITKSLLAAIIMAIISMTTYNGLSKLLEISLVGEFISLLGSILIGAIVYGVVVIVLKVEEVNMITNIVKKKLK